MKVPKAVIEKEYKITSPQRTHLIIALCFLLLGTLGVLRTIKSETTGNDVPYIILLMTGSCYFLNKGAFPKTKLILNKDGLYINNLDAVPWSDVVVIDIKEHYGYRGMRNTYLHIVFELDSSLKTIELEVRSINLSKNKLINLVDNLNT